MKAIGLSLPMDSCNKTPAMPTLLKSAFKINSVEKSGYSISVSGLGYFYNCVLYSCSLFLEKVLVVLSKEWRINFL